MSVSWEDDEGRWVERRVSYLTGAHNLREGVAETLARSELGHAAGGMPHTTQSTARSHLDEVEERFGVGPLVTSPPVPEAEDPIETETKNLRECPDCGEAMMVSLREAQAAFPNPEDSFSREIKAALESGKTHICSVCHTAQTADVADTSDDVSAKGYYRNVPDGWRETDRWIVWKPAERENGPTKVPLAPWATDGVRTVDKGNPHVWTGFENAVEWAQKVPKWGLGFVLWREGEYVGVDLDDCFEDGDLTETAESLVDRFDSFTEISPSGEGLHIIAKGTLPDGVRNKNEAEGVEIYDRDRYLTVTGDMYHDAEIGERQDVIDAVADEYLEEPDVDLSGTPTDVDSESPFYELRAAELFPDLPLEENVAHPLHDSKTGSNFKLTRNGEVGICWHGSHAVGRGDGCGLGAGHLLAMEATDRTECDQIREEYTEDNELVFKAWKRAVQEYDLPPEPAPSRALAHLADQVGMDIGADSVEERKNAYRTAKMMAKQHHGIDISVD